MKTFKELKTIHRELRDKYNENFSIRIHRALSWLNKAELEEDPDSKFIFLWISLNAAYSIDANYSLNSSDQATRGNFFNILISKDKHRINQIIWDRFSKEISSILNNEFILKLFWESSHEDNDSWKIKLKNEKKQVLEALTDKHDTIYILLILFKRLYVLRNQMFHGGSTWKGNLNRRQVNDGARIMSHLIPVFLEIMMNNPEEEWGNLAYPPVNEN